MLLLIGIGCIQGKDDMRKRKIESCKHGCDRKYLYCLTAISLGTGKVFHWVQCANCDFKVTSPMFDTTDEAVKAWNIVQNRELN